MIGFPRVSLTYRGLALPQKTWLYAQVLDAQTNRIVGVQVTPVPVTLDGTTRKVSMNLEAIATRATASSRYRLQVVAGSLIYGAQRSIGTVNLSRVKVSLPVIGRKGSPRGDQPAYAAA